MSPTAAQNTCCFCIKLQSYFATQKAISKMDKYSQREVLDNEWLTREVDLHRRDVDDMRKVVEDLEKGNLEIMAELFECKIEDLKVSRFVLLMNYTCPDQMQDIFALLV